MPTNRRPVLATSLLALSLAIAGCGPSWVIVKQAPGSPLATRKAVTIAALDWTALSISGKSSEAEWIAQHKPAEQAQFQVDWQKDKADAGMLFASHLAERLATLGIVATATPTAEGFGVQAHADMFEPGFWSPMGFGNTASVLVATVQLVDGSGVIDTVRFTARIGATVFNPVPGQRLRQAAQQVADQVASYIQGRRK